MASPRRIPLVVKLFLTAFVAVLVPVYLQAYGPTNFLYFCDVALLLALAAAWTERPLLASAPAVGILLPQFLWMMDFLATAVGGRITGMTAYMFSPTIPFFVRSLSFFHFWLPVLLAWLVWRLGYDRRAFWTWTLLAWVLVLVSYAFVPGPPAPADNPNLPVNINYVYGMSDERPQTWLPPRAWLGVVLVGLPLFIFLPTHLTLRKFAPRVAPDGGSGRL